MILIKAFILFAEYLNKALDHCCINGRLYGYPHIYSNGQEVYVKIVILPFENVYKELPSIICYIDGDFSGRVHDRYVTRSEINKHLLRFAFLVGAPLHASCVINDKNDAILIIGSHGSGKSTFAKFMMDSGFKLINDDTVLYNMENNKISGFKEGLYLRPEMAGSLSKDELSKVQDIAHGRKIFIETEKKEIIRNKTVRYTVLIDRNFQQSAVMELEEKDIYYLLENAHFNWATNGEERHLLKKAFSCLAQNTKCIYANLQNKKQAVVFCSRGGEIT